MKFQFRVNLQDRKTWHVMVTDRIFDGSETDFRKAQAKFQRSQLSWLT